MKCKECLYADAHPLGIEFHKGICSGCITHKEKYKINWDNQLDKLKNIIANIKKKSKTYDCVVPVISDAEDYYVLNKVLQMGLSPLVVSVNDYFRNDIGWHNYHNLITHFDVDSVNYSPELETYKSLVAASLRKYNHIHLPALLMHTAFPVHVAKERKIPLIIWGQNQAIEQVGKFSHYDEVQMSRWSRIEHDTLNLEIDEFIGSGVEVDERKLNYYKYPDISALGRKVTGIYLSNYFFWDPLKQNSESKKFGFIPEKNNASFDVYERAGISTYYKIHDLLKLKRCGYRKVLDQVSREIRHRRISREIGQLIEKSYRQRKVYIKDFFQWLGTTESGYEWFKKNKIVNFAELVCESNSIQESEVDNHNLDELLSNARPANEDFLTYRKGI